MTVLLWILGVLALPVVLAGLWLAWVFVKEFFSASGSGSGSGDGVDEEELAAAAEKLGLLPLERLNTELSRPMSDDLARARAAAQAGDWRPGAELLAGAGRDWQRRSRVAGSLGDAAAEADDWLLAWEKERPGDPDAAVVRARSTVFLAWEIRGSQQGKHTTREQFDGFHRTLVRAREDIARAAELNPDDPTPYIAEIWVALGLGYPNAEMDRLWAEIVARDPYHYEAHYSALQYWCAKWRGSEALATEFAERAAAGAPLGSLLTVLPLVAHFEHDESDDTAVDRTPQMLARVDAALADAAAADPAHPELPGMRHLLAFYLAMQDRAEAAVEQFRLVDGYIGALPWYYKPNPAEYYCQVRNVAAHQALAQREAGISQDA